MTVEVSSSQSIEIDAQVVQRFVMSLDSELMDEVATAFSCLEINALADLLRALGESRLADAWIHAHGEDDDEDDEHYRENCDDECNEDDE